MTELIAPRLIETILGGALVIAVATIWPTRLTYELGTKLASTARALRDYGAKVARGHSGDLKEEQQTMAEQRMESGLLVAAAAHEPVSPGLKIQYEQAQEVLDNLVEAAVIALAVEKSGEGVGDVPPAGEEITERSLERLDDLVVRLEAVQEGDAGDADASGGSFFYRPFQVRAADLDENHACIRREHPVKVADGHRAF